MIGGGFIVITENVKDEMDLSLLLDMYVHFDIQKPSFTNKTLGELLQCIDKNSLQGDSEKRLYDYLSNAVLKNDKLRNAVLISQSNCDGYSTKELVACTFRTDDGSVYVCYRGTGDGKWPDNAEAMNRENSLMQEAATSYYDNVMNHNDIPDDARVIVTGHSKGGNLAQYVTMTSDNRYRIDACYSMDGQGMSRKGIEHFKQLNGEENYNKQLDKMYSICGENDYVNVLGIRIIPADHKYFVHTEEADNFGAYHDMYYLGNKNYDGFQWEYKNDEIVSAEPGEVAMLAEKLNNEMLEKLNDEEYEDATVFIMCALERIMPYKGYIGGVYPFGTGNTEGTTAEEFLGFLFHGLPLAIKTLITTPEGQKALGKFIYKALKNVYDNYGPIGVVATVFLTSVATVAVVKAVIKYFGGAIIVLRIVDYVLEQFPELKEAVLNLLHEMVSIAVDAIQCLQDWYDKNLNQGFIQATENPYLFVDTDKMDEYAVRLSNVITRVKKLDRAMNGLYNAVRLGDLGNALAANISVGGTGSLDRCRKYLTNTKTDFEAVEKYICDIMGF